MKEKHMNTTIKGIAAPLPLANVDTDVIMPKRFLITITREGLADGTFADLRFDNTGEKRPEFILNKFYPKYNYMDINKIHLMKLDPNKEARFKVTRPSNYGERYKLFVIKKDTFEIEYSLEQYGISLIREENRVIVDTLQWNGNAKKSGFETGDYISEFKIENADRPNKGIIYPIAILLLIIFGYFNARRKE